MQNKGFNLELEKQQRSETDYIFGSTSPFSVDATFVKNIKKYLPEGELQNLGEDKMWCATASPINILQTKLNCLYDNNLISEKNLNWLKENGYIGDDNEFHFSSSFVAILSGTTRQGNSLKAPLETIRKNGLIPNSLLPQLNTWDENYNPERITEEIKNLGQEFLKRFQINYDIVYKKDFSQFIKGEMLDIAGYAWSIPVNGVYPPSDYPFNHAYPIFPPTQWEVFDSYLDEGREGDFIKTLSPDYKLLDYAYRLIITEKFTKEENLTQQVSLLTILKNLYEKLIAILTYKESKKDNQVSEPQQIQTPVVEPPAKPQEVSKYLWGNKEQCRHSVRVICDEEGLTTEMKNQLTETVKQESGFNPKALNLNKDKTWDCGIAQLNEKWYCKPNNMTCDDACNNPEKCIRIMCKAFLKGRQRDWISYRYLYPLK